MMAIFLRACFSGSRAGSVVAAIPDPTALRNVRRDTIPFPFALAALRQNITSSGTDKLCGWLVSWQTLGGVTFQGLESHFLSEAFADSLFALAQSLTFRHGSKRPVFG
jgi:hypothetical protein